MANFPDMTHEPDRFLENSSRPQTKYGLVFRKSAWLMTRYHKKLIGTYTQEIRMNEFSRIQSSSTPEKWKFRKKNWMSFPVIGLAHDQKI